GASWQPPMPNTLAEAGERGEIRFGLFVLRSLFQLGETLGEILDGGPQFHRRQAVVGRVNRRPLVVAGLEAVGARRRQRFAGAGTKPRLARIALRRVLLPLILDRLAYLLVGETEVLDELAQLFRIEFVELQVAGPVAMPAVSGRLLGHF